MAAIFYSPCCWQEVLGLDVFPDFVLTMEEEFYQTKMEKVTVA